MKGNWYIVDGNTIKLLMRVQGMNQKDVIAKSRLCRSIVSASMNYRPVSDYAVTRLARTFDVNRDAIIWKDLQHETEISESKTSSGVHGFIN